MSGPKVVRIVTREELLAQSNAIAARLEEAVRRWEAAARAVGEVTDDELAHSRATQVRWMQELQADRFAAFNEGANREIAFLTSDAQRRREVAAARRADARLSRARAAQNAGVLLKALGEQKIDVEPILREALELARAGRGGSKAGNAALAAGFTLLGESGRMAVNTGSSSVATPAQHELAQRLAANTPDEKFADWKEAERVRLVTGEARADPRLDAVARQLEILVLLESPSEVRAKFETRLDDIVSAQAGAQRSMRLDTLGMELTRAVQEARQWLGLRTRLSVY